MSSTAELSGLVAETAARTRARPGARMAVTDIVGDGHGYSPSDGDGAWAECGVGALQHDQLLTMITSAGLVDASIEYTHDTGPGLHGATIRARRP